MLPRQCCLPWQALSPLSLGQLLRCCVRCLAKLGCSASTLMAVVQVVAPVQGQRRRACSHTNDVGIGGGTRRARVDGDCCDGGVAVSASELMDISGRSWSFRHGVPYGRRAPSSCRTRGIGTQQEPRPPASTPTNLTSLYEDFASLLSDLAEEEGSSFF